MVIFIVDAVFFPNLELTELVLFLILTFAGSSIQNSWAIPLAAATRTIRELVLFKGSYTVYRVNTVYASITSENEFMRFFYTMF